MVDISLKQHNQGNVISHAIEAGKSCADGLADAAAVFDGSLRLVHYNGPYLQMTGLRRPALEAELAAGRAAFSLLGRGADEDGQVAAKSLADGLPMRLAEVAITNAQSNEYIVDIIFMPINAGPSGGTCLLQVIRDVSDESRMQSHYKDLLRLTEARTADLERLVEERTQELSAALESMTRLSRTDPLTGLLNRRAFIDHAEHALRLCERHARVGATLMCDLDFFKQINDVHGHQAGDAVLVEVARAFVNAVRKTDFVARIGGEEFIILLTETDEDFISEVCNRCMQAIRSLDLVSILGDTKRNLTVSIGAAVFPQHGRTLAEVMSSADQALYVAKRTGRDRIVMYSDRLSASVTNNPIRTRVLIADPNDERQKRFANALSNSCEIHFASSTTEAIKLCRQTRFEVILADEELDECGAVAFLSESLHVMPEAVRMLCLKRGDFTVAARATNVAGVDAFVLRDDVEKHLGSAIEDACFRRKLMRLRLLDGAGITRNAYTFRAEQLDKMLRNHALQVVLQPIVRASDYGVIGYETLSRPPAEFRLGPKELFDIAIEVGRLWPLGRLVRERVAERIDEIRQHSLFFVNLHPGELSDPYLHQIDDPLRSIADRVVFEITEHTPIRDYQAFREEIRKLRSCGYRIALDDLGAGYASLNSLAMLEPDYVKVDRELVRECHTSPSQVRVIQRIIEFARDQNAEVIAEGIETREEADQMKKLGCDYLQGYFIGAPSATGYTNF